MDGSMQNVHTSCVGLRLFKCLTILLNLSCKPPPCV